MKGYAFLPIAIIGALADPTVQQPPTLVERDLATVTSVIASVQSSIGALDTAVKGFTTDSTPVTSGASSLLDTLKSGTTAVTGSSDLSLADALALQSIVGGLQTAGTSLVKDLEAKKPDFEKAALCTVVLKATTDIGTASQGLIDAVVAKVPEAAQAIAAQLTAGVIATLKEGQAAFSAGNCTNAAGGGGSASSPASSPAPAPSTSAGSAPPAPSTSAGSAPPAPSTSAASAPPAPSTSAASPPPASTGAGCAGGAVTVTVTGAGACTIGTTTITSRRTSTAVAVPTGKNSTVLPSATAPATPPVVTAGAIAKGAVNVGAMLGMVAVAIAL